MAIEKLPPNQDGVPRTRISWYIGPRKIVRVLTVDVEAARKILREKLAERDLVKWGQTIPRTYVDAAREFLADKGASNCALGYLDELQRLLVGVLGKRWGAEKVAEISPPMIREYLHERTRKDRISPQTVLKERTMLGTFFRWAIKHDYIIRSPVDAVETPKVEKLPPRFLTPAEFRALWLASPDYLQPLLVVLVATGCRAEELCSLRRDHVRAGKILFEGRKCRDFVFVDAAEPLSKLLLGRPVGPSGLVFERPVIYQGQVKDRDAWTPDALRRAIQTAGRAAKLPETFTPHHLRHTAATWMLSAGLSVWDVRRILGHASTLTTERYSHVARINWREAQTFLPSIVTDCLLFMPLTGAETSGQSQSVQTGRQTAGESASQDAAAIS